MRETLAKEINYLIIRELLQKSNSFFIFHNDGLQEFEAGCVNQRVNHECYCKRDLLQIKSA